MRSGGRAHGGGGSHGNPGEGGSYGSPRSPEKGGSLELTRAEDIRSGRYEGHCSESDEGVMFDITRNLAEGDSSDISESGDQSSHMSHSSQEPESSESTDGELGPNLDLRMRSRRRRNRPAYLEDYVLDSD